MNLRTRSGSMARRGEDEEEASPLLPSLADQVQAPAEQEVSSDGTPDTSGNQMKQCRICFEDEDTPDNPLISPCKCRGHSRFIHRECLAKWRSSALQNPRNQAAFRCEVCHYKYRFVRSQAAGVVGHPLFVTTVFLLLLLLSFYVCGFIPLVQLCLKSFSIDFSHITLLVHMLDGVLVVGLLGMLGLALDMCTGGSRSTGDVCSSCWFDFSIFSGDCCGVMAMGEVAGVMCLVVVGLAAVTGLVMVLPTAYMYLYKKAQEAAGATVRMVENVGSTSSDASHDLEAV